jgi:hypothetical protein
MFEQSKITWHLSDLERSAKTSATHRQAIAEIAAKTGLMKKAVGFAKENKDPELAAAYLAMSVGELAHETHAPAELLGALKDLLSEVLVLLQNRIRKDPSSLAMPLYPSARDIHLMLMIAGPADGSQGTDDEGSRADDTSKDWFFDDDDDGTLEQGAPPFHIAGNMPDVTKGQPSRAFRTEKHLILFLRDLPPISEQLGPTPFSMRFTYVLVAVDIESQQPVYFVTLEWSGMAKNFLCTIDSSGTHSNLGVQAKLSNEKAFLDKAISILKERLRFRRIQEAKG